jgi:hypothetical protein
MSKEYDIRMGEQVEEASSTNEIETDNEIARHTGKWHNGRREGSVEQHC